jgi:serine/threonine protein phosphatase PrpC
MLQVTSGDVIILGSDGLWDNVAIDALVAEVKAAFLGKEGPPQLVRRITSLAFNNSIDKVRM